MASNQSIISDQVSKWKAEIRRLQDLIAHASSDDKAGSEQEPVAPIDLEFLALNLPVLADKAEISIRAFGEDWAAGLARDALQLLNQYDNVLRGLAMFLSAGGYNSEGLIDPKTADEKIRWGINHIVEVERSRASTHTDSKAPIDERARFEAWRTEFLQSTGRISVTPYEAWQARARLASQVPQWKIVEKDGNPPEGLYIAIYEGDGCFPVGLVSFGAYEYYDENAEDDEDCDVKGFGWHEWFEEHSGDSYTYLRNVIAYLPTNYDIESLAEIRSIVTAAPLPPKQKDEKNEK